MRTRTPPSSPTVLDSLCFHVVSFYFPVKFSPRGTYLARKLLITRTRGWRGGRGQGGGGMHPQCRLLTRTCPPPATLTVTGPPHHYRRRRSHSTYDKFNLIRYQTWFHLNSGAFHELISHKISDKGLHSERMVGILQRVAVFSVPSVAATRLGATLNACHLQNSGPVLTLKTPPAAPPSPPRPARPAPLIDRCNVNALLSLFLFFLYIYFTEMKGRPNETLPLISTPPQ